MLTTCDKCATLPYINLEDKEKLRVSLNTVEMVTVICPSCNKQWEESVRTDHGIINQMTEDFNDKV